MHLSWCFLLLFGTSVLQLTNGQLRERKWRSEYLKFGILESLVLGHQFGGKKSGLQSFDALNDEAEEERMRERLPRVVEVLHYDLEIRPYFPFPGIEKTRQDLTMDGIVTVYFQCVKETKSIWLFSQELTSVRRVTLKKGSQLITLDSYTTEPDLTRVTITPVEYFSVGQNYSLNIEYSGPIHEYEDAGLYYVKYTDAQKQPRYVVGTFFEALNARKMFPCFDDPHYKATFQLTVVYPVRASIFHNVQQKVSETMENPEQVRVKFAVTPKMSDYLLAFVIGNFQTSITTTKRNVEIKSISIPEVSMYLDESAKVAANCIDAMEELVKVNYPLDKLDNVEMIQLGHSSAMENWGLVVYTRFLSQLQNATPASLRLEQTSIICHELSHQWFGDLVTADYWGQEWLHESFAAFFQERAAQTFNSEVDLLESTMIMNKDSGLKSSLQSDHAVSANLSKFDDVTYASGGGMLRMFEKTVGTQNFFRSLTTYLNTHAYGNAVDSDLMSAFEATVDQKPLCGSITISSVMTDFFRQLQYPIVHVDFDVDSYSLSQSSPDEDSKSWNTPIFAYNFDSKSQHPIYPFFLQSNGSTCPTDLKLNSLQLLFFNHDSLTFARFRYSAAYWDRLFSVNLSAADDRTLLGLVLDAISDEDESSVAFKYRRSIPLIQKIIGDKNGKVAPHIVEVWIEKVLEFEGLFVGTNEQDLYALFVQTQLGAVYDQTNYTRTDWTSGYLNNFFLPVAVRYDIGLPWSYGEASWLFRQFKKSCRGTSAVLETCNPIVADSRRAAYCEGVRRNDRESIQFLAAYWQKLILTSDSKFYFEYELETVAQGLSCVTDEDELNGLLDVALDQNRPEFLVALTNHPTASEVLRKYLINNVDRFRRHLSLLQIALNSMISTWYTEEDHKKMMNLVLTVKKKFVVRGQQMLEEALERLRKKVLVSPALRLEMVRWLYDTQVSFGKGVVTAEKLFADTNDLKYDLTFTPHYPVDGHNPKAEELDTFDGTVIITYRPTTTAWGIFLDSHRHIIKSINVRADGVDNPFNLTRSYGYAALSLELQNQLEIGSLVEIKIVYTGLLFREPESQQQGVNVLSQYNSFTNETTNVLVTLLAFGASARSLVPCFDSPRIRAVWQIQVVHPRSLTVLSNQKVASTQRMGNYSMTTFSPTNPMPSYLLAIAIGKFQSISGVSSGGVDVRVWAAIGSEIYGQTALQAALDTLDFMDETIDVPYSSFNSKLDILAVPGYISAMANWGLVIGNHKELLYDSAVHPITQKRRVYEIVTHEAVHQWFGDLVSTRTWATTFLSEAFATYFESVVYDREIGYGEYFRFAASEQGLRYDEKTIASVIPADIKAPDLNPFTPVVNGKPASVFYMLKTVIGDLNFMNALSSYISNNQNKTADASTLWDEIQAVVDDKDIRGWNVSEVLDVQQLMDPFMRQASYPILTVTKKAGKIQVRQESYYPPGAMKQSPYNYEWIIPVSAGNSPTSVRMKWLPDDTAITWSEVPNFIVNWDRPSYARVLYDDDTWPGVHSAYLEGQLNETIRAQVLADNYALITRGDVKYSRLLSLFSSLSTENNEIPWIYAVEVLDELLRRLKDDKSEHDSLVSTISKWIGTRGKMPQSSKWGTRDGNAAIVHLQSRINRGKFVNQAQTLFPELANRCFQSVYGVDECFGFVPDARPPILCVGLQQSAEFEPEVNSILQHLGGLRDDPFAASRAEPFVEGIGCLRKPEIKQNYVREALDGKFGTAGPDLIKRIGELDRTLDVVYQAVVTNMTAAVKSRNFATAVYAMVADWGTAERLKKFQDIRWGGLSADQRLVITDALKVIQANVDWRKRNFDDVSNWLLNQ